MADLRGLPKELQDFQESWIVGVDELSAQLAAGDITIDEWSAAMGQALPQMMTEGQELGKGSSLTPSETAASNQLAAQQLVWLENFANDIRANGWLPAYTARAQQYVSSSTQAYARGDVIKQAGKMIPLPAMPGEGTICHSNCGCNWDIVVIDADKGDFDGYWQLNKTDNCQTCAQRARDWSPVEIRNNTLL